MDIPDMNSALELQLRKYKYPFSDMQIVDQKEFINGHTQMSSLSTKKWNNLKNTLLCLLYHIGSCSIMCH